MVQDNLIHVTEWTYLDPIPILQEKKLERYKVTLIEFEEFTVSVVFLRYQKRLLILSRYKAGGYGFCRPLPQTEPTILGLDRRNSCYASTCYFGSCDKILTSLLLFLARVKAPRVGAGKSCAYLKGCAMRSETTRPAWEISPPTGEYVMSTLPISLFSFWNIGLLCCVLFPVSSYLGAYGYLGVHQLR